MLITENQSLRTELKRFDGVDTSALLKACNEKAGSDYSEYINKNSMAVKDGNVTMRFPNSPEVLPTAETNRETAEKSCKDRYGV